MGSAFETLGLLPQFVQAVEQMGFEQPTAIQLEAIPALLEGRNVVGQAQTGSGKTAAFVLPMLQHILTQPVETGKRRIQALILSPTRELAIQVAEAAGRMAQASPLRVMPVYGGQSYGIQIRQLERGVDVVVGTPGRLIDLINKNILDLSSVRYMVLDEADEMLEMGFVEDVETILSKVPAERQITLFSATMPAAVRKLADRYVSDPATIAINRSQMTVAETEQRYTRVREENKMEALTRLLEMENVKSALIFARTKARAQELADELARMGYPADALHGDLSQVRREYVLNRFRQRIITLLVATDVAARGLDIEDVSHVFNYDAPGDAEDYVHRIGRTGRAGRKGVAITFFHPRDRARRKEIEAYTKQPLVEMNIPTREAIQGRRNERFIERLYNEMIADGSKEEHALLAQLIEANLDPLDIALAAIRMARASDSALPTADINEPAPAERSARRKYQDKESGADWKRSSDRQTPRGNGAWSDGPRNGAGSNGSNGSASNDSNSERVLRYIDDPRSSGRKNAQRAERWSQDAAMVRLKMNLGDAHGLRPGDVVGAIASEVGIPGKAIGEIAIFRNHTFVDISEKHVRKVLQSSAGQYQLHGRPVVLTLAS